MERLGLFVILAILLPPVSFAKGRDKDKVPACTAVYTIIQQDTLGNVQQGLKNPKSVKWVKNMEKKYPDVCYAPPGAPTVKTVFFIDITPASYNGTRIVSNTDTQTNHTPIQGDVQDEYGNQVGTLDGTVTSTTTTTTRQRVPYSFQYGIYTLTVESIAPDGRITARHRFQQAGIYHTMYGIPLGGRGHHPAKAVIEDAIKWIHGDGLADPLQTISPEPDSKPAQGLPERSEPDCGATSEEDARREANAWANTHPEYHPTPENAQKIIAYMESHRLCPTQQNFDTAYNAVREQGARSNPTPLDQIMPASTDVGAPTSAPARPAESAAGPSKTKPQTTVLMLGGRGGTFNDRFAAECPKVGMVFPSERDWPDFPQFSVALVEQPGPAWILFLTNSKGMYVVLAPENDVDGAVRRACNIVKKPESASWVPME